MAAGDSAESVALGYGGDLGICGFAPVDGGGVSVQDTVEGTENLISGIHQDSAKWPAPTYTGRSIL